MDAPTECTGVFGNRFHGPQKRVANLNSESLSGLSPKKQRLNVLQTVAERYSKFVNESTCFEQSPSYIKGELRGYQVQALNWLISLYENKIGGILADEMGLGKTVQSIAMLGYLKYFKYINGPFLIIGTKSVMSSWMCEFKKFCPTMSVVELTGDKGFRSAQIASMEEDRTKWDACVTTFEMIRREPFFRRHQWNYVVIDEGHLLANEKSISSKLIREMQSKNRLLLTGTPLQKNVRELWALLNYLMPDIFDETQFSDFEDDDESMESTKAILQPFFLRRVKADVEASLLPKIEHKLFVGLTKLQRNTYINVTENSRNKSKAWHLQSLRKIANHPYLIRGVEPGPPYKEHGEHLIKTSGKMMVLDKLLIDLKSSGSRVLLFSQSVEMLDIIEDYLDWRKYIYRRLDGETGFTKRANDIDEFNAPNSRIFIFIISTHAGALGINLQTADTVILFDSDWNPHVDLQAIDRAHRIGQTKQVRVYRLITENTIDESIAVRADVKMHLNNMMIERGRVFENSAVATSMKNKLLDGVKVTTLAGTSVIADVNMDEVLRYSQHKSAETALTLKNMSENELRRAGLEATSASQNWSLFNLDCYRSGVASSSANRTVPPIVDPNITQLEVATSSTSQGVLWYPPAAIEETTMSSSVHLKVEPTNAAEISETTVPPSTSTSVHPNVHPEQLIECSGNHMLNLSTEIKLKKFLIAERFPNWSLNDYETFCGAVQKYGRHDLSNVAELMMPSKNFDEVVDYHEWFFSRGPSESAEINSILNRIMFEEKLNQQRYEAFKWKTFQPGEMVIQPIDNRLRNEKFTALHDKYLVCAISRYGLAFDICGRIIADIRFHSDFGFFTTFKFGMMAAREIKDRINLLVSSVQHEYLATFSEVTLDDDKKPDLERLF